MIGRTIGNYVVRDKIGEGGMGVVYLAEHPRIGRRVAIKVLLPQLSSNPEVVARFFTEARASSAIKNEHIIDIIDFGELPDGSSYITMEWLEGESLAALLERERALPLSRVQHIARGIGRALTAAHAHGIVHRDLKPDNIFLVTHGDDRDFVKVLDFGIAKLMGDDTGGQVPGAKTRTGAIIGTPMYMSPEQCRGVAVDERSDTYSFGIILYQMLGGQVPFAAEGLGDLLLMHMTEPPRSLRELVPSLPVEIERAVQQALEKDPQKRYARVEQLVTALGVVGTGGLATPPADHVPRSTTHVSATDTIGAAVGEARVAVAARGARWGWVALPLVLGGALGAATLWPAPHGEPGGVVGEVHPGVSTVPPQSIVPPPTVTMVRFAVRATPENAIVRVDGVVHPNPWSESRRASSDEYEVTISAPGYATYHRVVTLEHDVTVSTTLAAETAVKAPDRHAGASRGVTTSHPVVAKPTPQAPDEGYRGTRGTLIEDDPFKEGH